MIPNLNEEKITEYDAKLVQTLKEHMLSVVNYYGFRFALNP